MKILLHGLNYAPEELGIGKYSGEMIRHLADAGHECVVVTTPPYYPHWEVRPGYRAMAYRTEREPAADAPGSKPVRVVRCPLWVPRNVNGIKRIIHLATFGLSSIPVVFWKALTFRPDVIMTVEPAAFCMPTTWLAARLCGAKAWLHVQDFEIDAAFDLGILKARFLRKLVLATESFLMRRFDRVSSISANMVKRVAAKGVAADRIRELPNWVDCNALRPLPNDESELGGHLSSHSSDHARTAAGQGGQQRLRKQFGIATDKFVALYAGTMGAKQGLDILVDAAREVADRGESHVQFVICGDGTAHQRIAELASGLPNVQMLPVQPFARFNELMNCADVHLLPQRADAADLVMPSKLTGMLATGRPVIAGAAAGTQIAVVVDGHGVVVPPGDSGSIAAAVIELSHDMPRCQQLGAAARQYAVAHLSRPSILYRFEHDLAELLGLPAPAAQQPSVDDLAAAEAETHLAPHFSGTATESHGRPLSTRR